MPGLFGIYKAERSHQWYEEEFYRTFGARNFRKIQQRFEQWLDFYNHQRPQAVSPTGRDRRLLTRKRSKGYPAMIL